MSVVKRRLATALAVAAVLGVAPQAWGEAAPDRARSGAYYGVHGGIIAAFVAGGLLLQGARPMEPGPDPQWFPGDSSVRFNDSPGAAALSNVTVALTVSGPAFAELARGLDYRLLNAGVVYGETLTANFALNAVVKVLFARPRPYTQGPHTHDPSLDDPKDRYTSFYSGHSSLAFAAAVSGSYLFAEAARDQGSRIAFWATEFTLAAATATLRVRAGKHYYSDVVVGALVGVGLGIGVPLIHGASYAPRPWEYLAAGSGLVGGVVAAELLPLKDGAGTSTAEALLHSLRLNVPIRGGATLSFAGAF